jgi:hypothetical protein
MLLATIPDYSIDRDEDDEYQEDMQDLQDVFKKITF